MLKVYRFQVAGASMNNRKNDRLEKRISFFQLEILSYYEDYIDDFDLNPFDEGFHMLCTY